MGYDRINVDFNGIMCRVGLQMVLNPTELWWYQFKNKGDTTGYDGI